MRWVRASWDSSGSFAWIESETAAGTWSIERRSDAIHRLYWFPIGLRNDSVIIGDYRTEASAKGASKRYAKKMAAAFKSMAKAGWQ